MQTLRKSSTASTTCSTPPPHDIYSIIVAEENRYIRKGYGLYSASLIALSYFYFAPTLCQYVWPKVLDYIQSNEIELWKFYVIVTICWHTGWNLFVNLAMWVIYHIELPFFERYKINSNPWPWN